MSLRPLTTFLRHALAGAVTIVACLVIWTVVYLVLLLWALLTDSALGGPLAYPAGLIAVLIFSAGASLALFFPATLLSEFICRRKSLPQFLAGIPLTCLIAAAAVFLIVCISAAISTPPPELSIFAAAAATFASLLVPLGIYWWAAQFPTLTTRLYHKLRRKSPPTEDPPSNRSSLLEP